MIHARADTLHPLEQKYHLKIPQEQIEKFRALSKVKTNYTIGYIFLLSITVALFIGAITVIYLAQGKPPKMEVWLTLDWSTWLTLAIVVLVLSIPSGLILLLMCCFGRPFNYKDKNVNEVITKEFKYTIDSLNGNIKRVYKQDKLIPQIPDHLVEELIPLVVELTIFLKVADMMDLFKLFYSIDWETSNLTPKLILKFIDICQLEKETILSFGFQNLILQEKNKPHPVIEFIANVMIGSKH